MRFQAGFPLACQQDRSDVAVELGSQAGGSSYFGQLLDDVRPDCGGVPLGGGSQRARGSQCSLPAIPSAPARFSEEPEGTIMMRSRMSRILPNSPMFHTGCRNEGR
ncbi:unnamed protein product [Prorocentrum cordatum]|uniref:Uncharacterized protein n=1 Tax=Prorocentrum cordatum TaxID=2364126 RepID=A0ABN9UNP5_9DINO|nr:unnamed protein product [Polarella glacialis]